LAAVVMRELLLVAEATALAADAAAVISAPGKTVRKVVPAAALVRAAARPAKPVVRSGSAEALTAERRRARIAQPKVRWSARHRKSRRSRSSKGVKCAEQDRARICGGCRLTAAGVAMPIRAKIRIKGSAQAVIAVAEVNAEIVVEASVVLVSAAVAQILRVE
jgi:hypothetical protein